MTSLSYQFNASVFRGWVFLWSVAAFSVALVGCKKHVDPPQVPKPLVETAVVGTADVPITRIFSGTVRAVKQVDIIPRVTGYLQERYYTEGALVQKGDPLYLIDPRPFEAALAEAEAQLKEDLANSEFYKEQAARYKRAELQQAASVEALQQAEARKAEADAAAAKDRAAIETAKLNLGYTKITAPFSGRVQKTIKNVGALVAAEKDVLTTIVQIDPVYIEFSLSRREMFEIQALRGKGFLFAPFVRVDLTLPDGKPHPKKGKIDFVASQVDPMTDSVLVRAIVPNVGGDGPSVNLISGQYVKVDLFLGKQPDAVVIPKDTLLVTQAGSHVYLVVEGNKVESRIVELGPVLNEYQVIYSGLKPGEVIVTSGLQHIRNGATVETKPAATPVPGQPTPPETKPTPGS